MNRPAYRRVALAAALVLVSSIAAATARGSSPRAPLPEREWIETYRPAADLIIRTSLATSFAWERLAELTDRHGARLSGSNNLERAIDWAIETMQLDGFENVRRQPVLVPAWVRGMEEVEIVKPVRQRIAMLGLGGTVATPPEGIEAEVLIVRTFAELAARSAEARGKIVVFNAPMVTYDETVSYRVIGPSFAARQGASAVLVRSIGPVGLRTPHTGALEYASDAPWIPAAAISVEDADQLQRLQDRGEPVVVRLRMDAHVAPDAPSANVIGEIVGQDRPDEIVLVGGHLDSWDVGTGASDDAVGCIVVWEAARLLKVLGLRPRRTVRVVLFTNEENGLRGAYAYRDAFRGGASGHVLAVESDSGVFDPISLGFTGSDRARGTIETIATLLTQLNVGKVGAIGGGADIGPIVQAGRVPALSLHGDPTRYFAIHHTAADTVDRIEPREVSRAAAAVAVMIYVVAEMPARLEP